MAAIEEDDRPKKKLAHEIGQDLALLSVEELSERIALLNDEIARLQAALANKRALLTVPSSAMSSAIQMRFFSSEFAT